MKQTSFLPKLRLDHGGDVRKGKRKEARPFSHKNSIHVILRSVKARGHWSMLTKPNAKIVEKILETCAKRYNIKIYQFINVGNHLHLLIKTQRRQYTLAKADFQAFLKQFAGEIAFQITKAKKASPKGGFWEKMAYSRIVHWGREYEKLKEYCTKNFYESVNLWYGPTGKNDGEESWLRARFHQAGCNN